MKILYIITSSGDAYYCGNCFRDNLMAQALRKMGHDVIVMPLYLPLNQMETDTPVFFPATSYYVAQSFFGKRHMPNWLNRLLAAKPLLNMAASMAGTTTANGMEDMTLGMIEGEGRAFLDQMSELLQFIDVEKPDIIHLPTSMLTGMARIIKQHSSVSVVCSLQDEEVWVDGLNEADARRAWQGIVKYARFVDGFVASSSYYKEKMKTIGLEDEKIRIIYPGIDNSSYSSQVYPESPTIGFFYRMNQLNGLDILAKAFVRLKQSDVIPGLKLKIGGGYTSQDRKFLNKVKDMLSPYRSDVEIEDVYSWDRQPQFYRDISVICVPLQFEESIGLYLLEAFAAGRPAVEPAIGSYAEIIGKAGVVYNENTVEGLYEALLRIFTEPRLMENCRQEALRLTAERYSSERAGHELISFYEEMKRK